jgi:hypothetical protein
MRKKNRAEDAHSPLSRTTPGASNFGLVENSITDVSSYAVA